MVAREAGRHKTGPYETYDLIRQTFSDRLTRLRQEFYRFSKSNFQRSRGRKVKMDMGRQSIVIVLFLVCLALVDTGSSQQSDPPSIKSDRANLQEEMEDYYKKWLKQDVIYIISDEEKAVFDRLKADDEREQFIEQFWLRRDADPQTAFNEFKEEHYRRIAYANEHFFSAKAGWRTDRGRTYILWGPPDDREMRPSAGRYERLPYEGGGTTVTYAFERWYYRHIPGIGSDIELEFVDKSGTAEYRLALGLEEKDALLHTDAGLTVAEELGMMDKSQRPYFTSGSANNPLIQGFMRTRAKDRPFARMARYFSVQKAPDIQYKDLQKLVDSRIFYHSLPFEVMSNSIKLDESRAMLAVSVELLNKDLTFKEENGLHRASVKIYGQAVGLTGKVLTEFEEQLALEYTPDRIEEGRMESSIYQDQMMALPGLYKLNLVLEDLHGGKMGTMGTRLAAPDYQSKKLATSPLILANSIRRLTTLPDSIQMFVLGDLKVIPNVRGTFTRNSHLPVYFQVYNLQVDQSLGRPSPETVYEVIRDGKVVKTVSDTDHRDLAYSSEERAVFVQYVDLEGLRPGDYSVQVTVQDGVSGESVVTRDRFKIQ